MKYLLKYWWLSLSIPIILGAFIFYNFPTGINKKTIAVFIIWCSVFIASILRYYFKTIAIKWWEKTKFWGQLLWIIMYLAYSLMFIIILMFALAALK